MKKAPKGAKNSESGAKIRKSSRPKKATQPKKDRALVLGASKLMSDAEVLFQEVISDQERRRAEDLSEASRPVLCRAVRIAADAADIYIQAEELEIAKTVLEKCCALASGYRLGAELEATFLVSLSKVFELIGDQAEAQACLEEALEAAMKEKNAQLRAALSAQVSRSLALILPNRR